MLTKWNESIPERKGIEELNWYPHINRRGGLILGMTSLNMWVNTDLKYNGMVDFWLKQGYFIHYCRRKGKNANTVLLGRYMEYREDKEISLNLSTFIFPLNFEARSSDVSQEECQRKFEENREAGEKFKCSDIRNFIECYSFNSPQVISLGHHCLQDGVS